MCGIAGFYSSIDLKVDFNFVIDRISESIFHRGPDDMGFYLSSDNRLALIHRRLSILDLSKAGHQPMVSQDSRYTIVFNGEIYNHLSLRVELEKNNDIQWIGQSDTETLLKGIEFWGVEETVKRCVGMFAFVLWNELDRTLTLCRDRVGEKPLYYGICNGVFLFGSELKALRVHPAFDRTIDMTSVALMLRYKNVPGHRSIYKNINKLLPGTILTVNVDNLYDGYTFKRYWSFDAVAKYGIENPFDGSEKDMLLCVESTLKNSVAEQMISDVPLGAFLSGGTDSSLIAALMQDQCNNPIKTFTVGFNVPEYNEAEHAKAVAAHLGSDHTEIYVGEQDALNVIPKLSQIYDEPFADSSQIPTYLIAAEARKHVTVALSGDAGDELFAGYTRYSHAINLSDKVDRIPKPCFKVLQILKPFFNSEIWSSLESSLGIEHSGFITNPLMRLAELSALNSFNNIYEHVVSTCKQPDLFLNSNITKNGNQENFSFASDLSDKLAYMMLHDCTAYLPDDILVKVDRAAMAASLETRVPMLDHRFIELAFTFPSNMKSSNGIGKLPLKRLLHHYVPKELLERPKAGFGVPIDHWLRGPLKDWAESLLDTTRLSQQGIFDPVQVRRYWQQHLSGKRNWQYLLWNLLMFQSWLELN